MARAASSEITRSLLGAEDVAVATGGMTVAFISALFGWANDIIAL